MTVDMICPHRSLESTMRMRFNSRSSEVLWVYQDGVTARSQLTREDWMGEFDRKGQPRPRFVDPEYELAEGL